MGLALVVGLAVSPVSSAAVIAITGFAFGLIVAVAEGALAFRRLRRLKAGVATKQEKACLRDRLKFFHDLRPRLSRRLLPKPPDDDRSRSS